jgi:hypothetical protein
MNAGAVALHRVVETSGCSPGGPSAGQAIIRFTGAGAFASIDVAGESIAVPAGARGTWTISYRPVAWPIQPGGSVTLSKWGPKFVFGMALQARDPVQPDYCSARLEGAEQSRVQLTDLTPQYKRYRQARLVVEEAALRLGATVSFVAGDTSGGAPPVAVPAYTARDVRIDVQVDHDGDGYPEAHHQLWLHIVPGPATRLRAVAPSTVNVGEPFAVRVHAEDEHCNPGAPFSGTARLLSNGSVLAEGRFQRHDAGTTALRLESVRLGRPGIYRLEVEVLPDGPGAVLQTQTNPIRVMTPTERGTAPALRAYWGEMHNHTTWCEGMATVEENYRFAQEDACLDWYSASEHIMLGPGDDFPITDEDSPMASSAAYWRECQAAARRHHEPGRFVTYIGYEWTALLEYDARGIRRNERRTWGDHCAWFLRDDHPLVIGKSLDEELTLLASLANEALADGERPPAMIIPHPGGGATDWTHYAGRDLIAMPSVETCSQHAHTEWFYQRAIETGQKDGFRLGVCGMDDGHMGHPGYDVWSRHGVATLRERAYSVQGGLTAVLAPELTREAIWDGFFDRRTYATSGERMLLDVWVENATTAGPADPRHRQATYRSPDAPEAGRTGRLRMGQAGAVGETPRFRVQASGTAPLDLVEIIRNDRRVQRWVLPPDTWDVDLAWIDERPLTEEAAYYVRVTQTGDAFAWSSPLWLSYTGTVVIPQQTAVEALPLWNEGVWPPEGTELECAAAAAHLPAALAHLARYGAAEKYGEWKPVGLFREHRGRYALFRGYENEGGNPVHLLYYPDFAEDRIRIGSGWVDYGAGPNRPRLGRVDR